LDDQLFLAFFSQVIKQLQINVESITIHQFKVIGDCLREVQGLGLLKPDNFQHPDIVYQLDRDLVSYLEEVWGIVSASSPDRLNEYLKNKTSRLPLLKRAVGYLVYRYPSILNGLSIWDERILKNTVKVGSRSAKVIGFTLVDGMDELDYVGDWYLFNRLVDMADIGLNKPLLRVNSNNSPMRETFVDITEYGRLALNGDINAVKTNGISDWIAGVHLDASSGHCWFRTPGSNVLESHAV
jgi:hypothetical protein